MGRDTVWDSLGCIHPDGLLRTACLQGCLWVPPFQPVQPKRPEPEGEQVYSAPASLLPTVTHHPHSRLCAGAHLPTFSPHLTQKAHQPSGSQLCPVWAQLWTTPRD